MKRRVLTGIMITVLALASVMGVSAADSVKKDVYPTGGSTGTYVITEGEQEFAIKSGEDATKHAAALEVIKNLEEGKAQSISTEIDKTLSGKTMVVKFFDLDEKAGSDHTKCTQQGYHEIELNVSAVANCKNVVVLHYSQTRQVWETKEATVSGTTVKFQLADLSPVAIYAEAVSTDSTGTSPSTEGTSSTWMIWTAAALIVLGAGVVVAQKKR